MANLIMNMEVMSNNDFEEKLYKLLENIDQDFVGANGEEYLCDKAKSEGFSSNLDYSLSKAKKEYDDLEKIINSVIFSAMDNWSGYYESSEFSVKKINENYVVAISVVDNY